MNGNYDPQVFLAVLLNAKKFRGMIVKQDVD